MTPTLWGRIQTRLFLMLTIGLLITIILFPNPVNFFILFCAILFGFVWDVIYIFIQKKRWDRDFPFSYQFIGTFFEGVFLYMLIKPDLFTFALHYGTIFIATFLFLIGPMQVFFPRWRFKGAEFGKI